MREPDEVTDYLIIGSGLAGLTCALHLPSSSSVTLLTKRGRDDGATALAQGGVAAVLGDDDSFASHADDTLDAGAGLCRPDVVRLIVEKGPDAIELLRRAGADFTTAGSQHLQLGLEGGHGQRRIVHAADATGQEVERAMLAQCEARSNIVFCEQHMVIDLITRRSERLEDDRALGVYVLDQKRGRVRTIAARRAVMLASGGSGKAYLFTSNPDVATGDGVAMAFRARVPLANMEFVQFHPTCFFNASAKSLLISEALRGEGGVLRLQSGETFMERYDPRGCLAPRDIVARAIDAELKRTGDEHALLDMRHLERSFLLEHFPTIYETLLGYGLDMHRQAIPVVPAAHYQCGGVLVDTEGRSALPGLFALGECACTGLHGANRLASNSLLEAVVISQRAARVAADISAVEPQSLKSWDPGKAVPADEHVVVAQNWDELRRFMWNYVGVVRTDRRLRRALRRLDLLDEEIREYYWKVQVDRDLLELRNLATVARLVVASALHRRESRGLHYNLDCSYSDDAGYGACDTVVTRSSDYSIVYQPFLGRHERPVQWRGWTV